MRQRFSVLGFIPVMLVAAFVSASRVTADHQPAHDLDQAWIKAAQAGNVEGIVALYAPDATLYTPDAMELKGHDAIRKAMTGMFGAFTISNMRIDGVYETQGDMAVGWGPFTMTATPKAGGAPMVWKGRTTVVAKKINGKWLYVVDHASMPMPAEPPATKPSSR